MSAIAEIVMKDRPTNGAERRAVNQLLRQALALELIRKGDWKLRLLDDELRGADRVCQRWAISVGSGMFVEQWDETPVSRLSPLDDATAILVDQIILRSPERVRRLILPWYKGTGSTTTLERKLGVDRDALHLEWRASLFYLKRCFEQTGYPDLLKLLEVRL